MLTFVVEHVKSWQLPPTVHHCRWWQVAVLVLVVMVVVVVAVSLPVAVVVVVVKTCLRA